MNKISWFWVIICILFAENNLHAQVKPDFFPEDLMSFESIKCYCKPGVTNKSRSKGIELNYEWSGSGTYQAEDTPLSNPLSQFRSFNSLQFKIKAPIINRDRLKLLFGYEYFTEFYRFDRIGADFNLPIEELDNNPLKSNAISLILTRPINEKYYTVVRAKYTTSGNYSDFAEFDDRYAIYRGLVVFGIKPRDDFEWGIGLNYSKSFRRNNFIPFIVYNRSFNERWGIESAFPGFVFGRYNLNPKNILLFGAEYSSDSYRLEIDTNSSSTLDYAFNHSELLFSVRLERQIHSWIWLNVKTGYRMNFSSDFEAKNLETTAFNVSPTNTLFLRVGIFLSPPDDLLK